MSGVRPPISTTPPERVSPHGSCPRQVCSCGTAVLFPGGVTARTCWNCGVTLEIGAPAGSQKDYPRVAVETSPAAQFSFQAEPRSGAHPRPPHVETSRQADAPWHPPESPVRPSPRQPAVQHRVHEVSASSSSSQQFSGRVARRPAREDANRMPLWILLGASVLLNIVFFTWQRTVRRPVGAPPMLNTLRHDSVDTDGDGIPDHHDFCPNGECKGAHCPPRGWISGPATDFDGDGCADGIEDHDKDNDGIVDARDRCPFTPQKYVFVSNSASDFDADGCADGIEDNDDDNDLIPNRLDNCPLTGPGDLSDGSGCSQTQRAAPAKTSGPLPESPAQHRTSDSAPEKPSRLEAWMDMVRGAGLETVVGAILAAILAKAHGLAQSLPAKMPSSPTEATGHEPATHQDASHVNESSRWMRRGLRVLGYVVLTYFVHSAFSTSAGIGRKPTRLVPPPKA